MYVVNYERHSRELIFDSDVYDTDESCFRYVLYFCTGMSSVTRYCLNREYSPVLVAIRTKVGVFHFEPTLR